MMYKIDWDSYLSIERFRDSEFNKRKQDENANEFRTPFESDFGRVIFSSAIRRMHDKTQVMPLSTGDSVHTRLTHSLEVMSIAYSLGVALCRDKEFREIYKEKAADYERDIPMILKTAALVHDIGNPPFGHFGEAVIQNFFDDFFKKDSEQRHNINIAEEKTLDFTRFDGNAQGFRILTRLQYLGDLAGLNLTYATLAAYTKYPNDKDINEAYIGTKKHGIFTSESEILHLMSEKCHLYKEDGNIKRHPLSFLTEAADSISYNIMDIEDGLSMGWYTFNDILQFIQRRCDNYKSLNEELRIENLKKFEGDDKKKMASFRVAVISRQVNKAIEAFKSHLEEIDKGTYTKELIEDNDKLSEILQKFAQRYIFPNRQIEQIELTGHSVIFGLLEKLISYAFHNNEHIQKHFRSVISKTALKVAIHSKENIKAQDYKSYSEQVLLNLKLNELNDYLRLRMIVDFISGMTDKYAVSLYQKLCGLKL